MTVQPKPTRDQQLVALLSKPRELDWMRSANHKAERFIEAISECGIHLHIRKAREGWVTEARDMHQVPFVLLTDDIEIADDTFEALWDGAVEDE